MHDYYDLLRRVLLCIEDHQMVGIEQDSDLFNAQERQLLRAIFDGQG